MKQITQDFPYSKEEFINLCAEVDTLTLATCQKASSQYSSKQVFQILKGYQTLKYPLMIIWEYYGFGEIDEILAPFNSENMYKLYISFETIRSLEQTILGVSQQNPFDFYGRIENSDVVVEKMLVAYKHLLHNLKNGTINL